MKNFLARLILGFLFLAPAAALAQSSGKVVADCSTGVPLAYPVGSNSVPTILTTGANCISGTFSASITLPTIGAAVPATGMYNAVNVAGTLRGWSGLSTGSIYPGAVAIVDASGNQVTSFGGTNASVGATGAAVPASATYLGIISGGNLTGWTGAVTQGTSPWIIAGGGTAGSAASAVTTVQGIASMTPLAVSRDTTINSATHGLYSDLLQGDAVLSATNGLYSNVLQGNAALSATNGIYSNILQGNAVISATNGLYSNQLQGNAVLSATNPTFTQPVAGTAGGASSYYVQPTASDNHVNIKNGAGTVYSIHVTNNSATKNYLRLYDAGTGFNGCNSATGLIFGLEIPPTDSGFSGALGGSVGLAFATGLSICVTSGYGSTDTTNATATAMMANVLYK